MKNYEAADHLYHSLRDTVNVLMKMIARGESQKIQETLLDAAIGQFEALKFIGRLVKKGGDKGRIPVRLARKTAVLVGFAYVYVEKARRAFHAQEFAWQTLERMPGEWHDPTLQNPPRRNPPRSFEEIDQDVHRVIDWRSGRGVDVLSLSLLDQLVHLHKR